MSELIERAIDKIDKQAEKGETLTKALAQYIIDNLICDDEKAQKILDEKKTLSECTSNIMAKAKKEATDGMAVIPDNDVFSWVEDYFEIHKNTEAKAQKPKKSNIIDVDFDSFM